MATTLTRASISVRTTVLPIAPLPPSQIGVGASAITDAATKALVDRKLDAALKAQIKDAIGSTSPDVAALVDGIALDYHAVLGDSVLAVIKHSVVPALRANPSFVGLADALAARPDTVAAPTIAALLQPTLPLDRHPLFVADVRRGKTQAALQLTKLPATLLEPLDANAKQLEAWNESDWASVTTTKTLTPAQRDDLRFTVDLSRLTGERYDLVSAVRSASVTSMAGLVVWDAPRWLAAITSQNSPIPAGLTAEQFANQLSRTVQETFPSQYLAARVAVPTLATDRPNTFRHLGSSSDEVAPRVALLNRFLASNADQDLRYVDLLASDPTKTSLQWSALPAADQAAVRAQLLAYQRVLHLAPNYDVAQSLLSAGLDSSADIADLSYREFRDATALSDADATPVYQKALTKAHQVANSIQAQKDVVSAIEQGSYFQGLAPKYINDLKDLPGWADLFGSTTYCDCDDCSSIFSPAAYFVDLMYFIEKHITKIAFAGKPQHPIRLDIRRPDLWHLKLTCANTNTLIPQVVLINEILEAYLTRTLGLQQIPQLLATDRTALTLPYHSPLASMRELLSDWDLELATIYALLGSPSELHEVLHLSDAEWTALATAAPLDTGWIKYPTADHTQLQAVTFETLARVSRAELDVLRASKTAGGFTIDRIQVGNDIQSQVEVVKGLSDTLVDRIGRFLRLSIASGFTLGELDVTLQTARIATATPFSDAGLSGVARFRRLAKRMKLSVESLIGILDHIPTTPMKPGGTSLADTLHVGAFSSTFPIAFHHAHFNTSNPADAAVDAKLPALLDVTGLTETELVCVLAACPAAFVFSSNGDCQITVDNLSLIYAYAATSRAWRISVIDLVTVVAKLLPAANGGDFRSLDLLEQLDTIVRQLQTIPIAVSDLFAALDPATATVTTDAVVAIVTAIEQANARVFGSDALAALPGMVATAITTALGQLVAAGLIAAVGDKFALTATFTPDTDLAPVLVGLPPTVQATDVARTLLAFHVLELLPNVLGAVVGLPIDKALIAFALVVSPWTTAQLFAAITTPIANGVPANPADLKPLLALADDLSRIATIVAGLGLDADDLWFLAQYPAVLGVAQAQQLTIGDLVKLRTYRQLRKTGAFSADEIQNLLWQYYARTHGAPGPLPLFGGATTVPVFAAALTDPLRAARVAAAAPSFPAEALVPSPFNADELALLALRLGSDARLLRSIFLSVTLDPAPLVGVLHALDLYALCSTLGTQGPSLPRLVVRDFAAIDTTATWLHALLETKYPTSGARDKNILPHDEAIAATLRDALCDFIIARDSTLKFADRDDLYAYFLIDVQVGGCFETSRVVAALSSLQLYVYRCLVDLEQATSDGLDVLSKIDADDIRQQWEWRKNYRVWEANRKVFIYPENYLEPELRDDKTPLAQDLEDALSQQNITLDAAADAYHDYLSGFSTLAQLEVAGSCFDAPTSCYWFVARSHTDPYQYFCRQYHAQTKRWDAWESIDVGINSPYVSPIIHLGRLYLFWVEVLSTEKTDFVDGNSIFLGIEHQVTLHHSYRGNNEKWATDQKEIMIDKIVDRAITNITPPFIASFTNFKFLTIDKPGSNAMADFFRQTKTYVKCIVTEGGGAEDLLVHYFREGERYEVELDVSTVTIVNGHPHVETTKTPVSDATIDALYIAAPPGTSVDIPSKTSSSVQYFRGRYDLLLNKVTNLDSSPVVAATDGTLVPAPDSTPEDFQDGGNGVEAVGILVENSDPTSGYFSLMLRSYANAQDPAATDAMLVTPHQLSGTTLTQPINIQNPHDVLPINQKQDDTVLRHYRHQHWIHRQGTLLGPRRLAIRINTTLDFYLTEVLFSGGIEQFLTLETQTTKGEEPVLFDPNDPTELAFSLDPWGVLPYTGTFGGYYRELFFHIPFLIANQLNAQGRYEDAKYWYEKIFDPTAKPPVNDANPKHRVWQYYEFRDVTVPTLKQLLTNSATIDVYQHDPFEPFAIARLRMSAFQKAIVMKYVDNLLDWADSLFTEDTMESVNEATMLYVLASDILGPRPVSVGPCETVDENQLTYAVLGPAIAKGSEFLMYLENIHIQIANEAAVQMTMTAAKAVTSNIGLRTSAVGDLKPYQARATLPRYGTSRTTMAATSSSAAARTNAAAVGYATQRPSRTAPGRGTRPSRPSRPARPDIARQYLPAFCVPPNDILLAYWDRIADRLFKIRNCLDINGQRVTIPLFQPPIDPMMLVRAKAAGVSIEDVIGQQEQALPPYRFSFLVEKARQYASTMQAFGGALLAALEKKDGETLSLLRSTHEQNLLKMQRANKVSQVADAEAQLAGVLSQQRNSQNKFDYYNNLVQSGLNTWEATEQGFKALGTGLRTAEAALHLLGGLMFLIGDVGSPFAMKYGGTQLGHSQDTFAAWYGAMAQFAETSANSASQEASFQRRADEWDQQLKVASEELLQLQQQVLAAQIRVQIAQKEVDVHDSQLAQAEEVHDFLTTKFSNIELYTFLTSQLMRLYREAYQTAAQLARQAERSFQFERDSTETFVQNDNWQAEVSGLLAGERLLLQLGRMEKAYLDANVRDLEISQSFSLAQLDPQALQGLQETGKCQFTLDETWFDIQYPGHYRRLLKSVRATIPCVIGPFINVGARLRLEASQLRRVPKVDPGYLVDVPLTMTRIIATSHAQSDGGVFDLNFKDERYLPFEGAGAVNSTWTFELPGQLRTFDYRSISDVIINLSYTAKYDDMFAVAVETNIVDQLKAYAQAKGLFRMVSLRHEFPDAFYQLIAPPVNQTPQTTFALDARQFPAWLAGQTLHISGPVAVWPRAVAGQTVTAASSGLAIGGASVGGWVSDGTGSSRGTVTVAGSPLQSYKLTAAAGQLTKDNTDDVLFLVKYTVL